MQMLGLTEAMHLLAIASSEHVLRREDDVLSRAWSLTSIEEEEAKQDLKETVGREMDEGWIE